jgi:hypothetical protein
MSHSVTLVLAPKNVLDFMSPEDFVEKQLAPYNEDIQVAPYDKDCYCVGNIANKKIREQLESEMPLQEIRNKHSQYCKDNNVEKFSEEAQKSWKEFLKPYNQREAELTASQEGLNDPDPDCEECKGTGIVQTTYNPDSKWDWWVIGGRWTGYLGNENPEDNPKNWETCKICDGTGDRQSACLDEENGDPWVSYKNKMINEILTPREYHLRVIAGNINTDLYERTFKYEQAKACNGCNGCQGTGKTLKWTLEPSNADQMPLENLLLDDPEQMKSFIPFAIVTPDGKWYEKGNMGWFAIVSDAKDTWKEEALELLKQHRDCVAIVVDCHI